MGDVAGTPAMCDKRTPFAGCELCGYPICPNGYGVGYDEIAPLGISEDYHILST